MTPKLVSRLLCSKIQKLLPAVKSCKKMGKMFVWDSRIRSLSQLILDKRNLAKLLLYPQNTTGLETISTLACSKNHLSHIIQIHSEVDFHNQQLLCHTKTLPKLLLVTDQPTTRGSSFPLILIPTLNQNNLRQATRGLLLIRLLELNICKNCEQKDKRCD